MKNNVFFNMFGRGPPENHQKPSNTIKNHQNNTSADAMVPRFSPGGPRTP